MRCGWWRKVQRRAASRRNRLRSGIYERAEQFDRAVRAYEIADATGDAEVRRHALARLAVLHRRASRHDEAAAAWQHVLDLVPRGRRGLTPLERRAVEALAIHHEHRAHDLTSARRYAEALSASVSGRQKADTDKRLQRISRKLSGPSGGRNGTLGYDQE